MLMFNHLAPAFVPYLEAVMSQRMRDTLFRPASLPQNARRGMGDLHVWNVAELYRHAAQPSKVCEEEVLLCCFASGTLWLCWQAVLRLQFH